MKFRDIVNHDIVNLENCADEPIHVPGSIQPHGFLLAVDTVSDTIVFASANVSEFTGLTYEQVLEKKAEQILGTEQTTMLANHIASADLSLAVPVQLTISGNVFSAIPHVSENYYVLEFEPTAIEKRLTSDIYQQTKQFTTYMQSAGTLKSLCDAVAQETRKITGFDRVMVYKFDESYNGHVIAESLQEGVDSFYDLHYPHTDIPIQARALYIKNLLRIIVDVNYEPSPIFTTGETKNLDLSYSVLRSVSPIHIQYLKNMGVSASMSISLIYKDKLWGLIACHHHSPRYISGDVRLAAQLQGYFLTSQIDIRQHAEEYDISLDTDKSLNKVLEIIYSKNELNIEATLENDDLITLANATGVAILVDDKIYQKGKLPLESDLRKLFNWLHSYSPVTGYSTEKLISVYPDSQHYSDLISGLIFHPLSGKAGNAILWTREETIREVTWAGNPNEAVIKTETSYIAPRQSFEKWKETRRSESGKWLKPEISAARNFAHALDKHLHMVFLAEQDTRQRKLNEKLKEANSELENLYWIGSHDLKEPLRKIQVSASRIIDEDAPANLEQIHTMIRRMNDSAKRMQHLITDIISYSKVNSVPEGYTEIALDKILRDALDELKPESNERNALIKVSALPVIKGVDTFLHQLFINLLKNSLKFFHPDRTLEIDINYEGILPVPITISEDSGLFHKINIIDNGIGFDDKFSESIFKVFSRLHAKTAYAGSGVGLALSRKIMAMHNGYISASGELQKGAIFSLYFPAD